MKTKTAALPLVTVLLLAPLAALHAADAPIQNPKPKVKNPNVLIILADDLGWADTTLYGHTRFYQTPNVERLAKRGMTFTRAYSASPLCSPTRSAMLTGLSPARTGITTPNCHLPPVVLEATTGNAAPPDQKSIQPTPPTRLKTEYRTLAESLKEAGYATGHFGKPAVSVHRGDWKLIRIFHGGENGAHRYLLFNLRDDLSEKDNLAAQKPELVSELDALVTQFLADTKAVVPVPNPAFDPAKYHPELEGKQKPTTKPKPQPRVKDDGDPALQGWKARSCTAKVESGIVTVRNLTDASFLGFAAGKHSGPSTVKLRIKAGGGASHLDWLPGGVQDRAQSVPFTLPGGDWQELSIEVPATGPLGIVRIYLPKQDQPVEIDWIEITSKTGKTTRTEF